MTTWTPSKAARGLSKTMKAHIKHGIGGATNRTLDALEARGLVRESSRRPGYLELSARGLCVKTLLLGHDPESLGDSERVELRQLGDDAVRGPAEFEPCGKHPGNGSIYRWVWRIPKDGEDHLDAISCSEPCVLESCPECEAEQEMDEPWAPA